MRRIAVAALLFLIIATLWIWETNTVDGICKDVSASLEQIKDVLESEDNEKSGWLIEDFELLWKEKEKVLDALTAHDETDQINVMVVRLKRYIQVRDGTSALGLIEEMNEHIKEIPRRLKITWVNIF